MELNNMLISSRDCWYHYFCDCFLGLRLSPPIRPPTILYFTSYINYNIHVLLIEPQHNTGIRICYHHFYKMWNERNHFHIPDNVQHPENNFKKTSAIIFKKFLLNADSQVRTV